MPLQIPRKGIRALASLFNFNFLLTLKDPDFPFIVFVSSNSRDLDLKCWAATKWTLLKLWECSFNMMSTLIYKSWWIQLKWNSRVTKWYFQGAIWPPPPVECVWKKLSRSSPFPHLPYRILLVSSLYIYYTNIQFSCQMYIHLYQHFGNLFFL